MDTEYLKGLGERIKKQRTLKGMTQIELGIAVGYNDKSSIAKIEAGTRDISHDKIIKFAKALGVSEAYLMGWDSSPWADTPVQNKAVDMLHEHENKQLMDLALATVEEQRLLKAFRKCTPEQRRKIIDFAVDTMMEGE